MKEILPGFRSRLRRFSILITATDFLLIPMKLHADEQLFGFVRGAETLPKNRMEVYQFTILRPDKDEGAYGSGFAAMLERGRLPRLLSAYASQLR